LKAITLGGMPDGLSDSALPITAIPFSDDPSLIASYLSASDLYLHAAHAENLPLAILEAQSCGLPVITTDVGGIHETFVDGQTGILINQADSVAMADAIIRLADDDELRLAMKQAARINVLDNFTLSHMANRYIQYYEESIRG
jgi:glycosyltransferase involved in cell wall biosynthesis